MISVVVQEDQLELKVEQAQDVLALRDEGAVGFHAINAKVSAAAAAASEVNAAASETAAATSETNAAESASQAGLSASSAWDSAGSASASANNAATSETNAAGSASAAAGSETSAAASQVAAAGSESDAAGSAAAAGASESNAATSATNAATSETNAAGSASAAATNAANANTSATNAAGSATAAGASQTKAGQWAENGEDVEVEAGQFSAKHHAIKAAASAAEASDPVAGHVAEADPHTQYVKKTGNETIVGDKTFTGQVIVGADDLRLPSDETVVAGISGGSDRVLLSPVASQMWHDMLRWSEPTYERSADGDSWTSQTLNKNLFSGKQNQTILVATVAEPYCRFTWDTGIAFSMASVLAIGFTWVSPAPQVRVLIEVSDNETDWTELHDSTAVRHSQPIFIRPIRSIYDQQLRVTFQNTSGSEVRVSTIRLLTARWGNQGQGRERELPYDWDAERNFITYGTLRIGSLPNQTGNFVTTTGNGTLRQRTPTQARGDIDAEPAGTAAGAVSTHEGAADPHPQYPLASALGTAAAANLTIGHIDTDGTRAMRPGNFGIGGVAATPATADLNNLLVTGIYQIDNNINGPDPGWVQAIVVRHNETYVTQIATKLNPGIGANGRMWIRNLHQGTWGPWREFYHVGNLAGDRIRKTTISVNAPSGGADGDVWLQY